MKISALLLLICFQAMAHIAPAQITLKESSASLEKVLKTIQQQSDYDLFFSEKLVRAKGRPVVVNLFNVSVEKALVEVFKNQDQLTYSLNGKIITIKEKEAPKPPVTEGLNPRLESPPPAGIDVTITVVGADNNQTLEGASVIIKGQNKGIATDINGRATLKNIDPDAIIVISFTGYANQEIKIAGRNSVVVKLVVSATELQEVVINKGYYTEKQRLSTGNVSRVTSKEIEKSPVSNVLLAMQGRVPGMQITQSTGLPGTGVTVRIRGQNSITNGNDPLYVVDGVPYQSQMLPGLFGAIVGTSGGYGDNKASFSGSPLNYINPNDIESVEILKDADATAIYGTRGANGVVLITTKKGKTGPLKVDINVQQGWGKVTRFIPWMNLRQYLDMRYEAYRNDGISISSLAPGGDNYDLTVWDTTRSTDWNKELIGGTARFTNMQLSIYGGNQNANYRIGYNYNKQTTVFPSSFGDPKGSLSFAVNGRSNNQKLNVELSGNYQLDKTDLPTYDLSQFTNLPPNAPSFYNADGSLNWAPNPINGFPTWRNPLALLNGIYKRRVNNLVTNAVVSYQILSGLEIKANAGFTSMQSKELQTVPKSMFAPIQWQYIDRASSFSTSQNESWIIEPQLAYTIRRSFGEVSVLCGTTIQQNTSSAQELTATVFSSDLVMEDIKAAGTVQIASTTDAIYKYNAVFARANYNYNDKYLINLTARRDGTSRFGPDKQFANFGAAGIGWLFSRENFISKALPFLSFGKIRASYGTSGSDQVGDYRFLNLYRYVNYPVLYQNSGSLTLSGLFNPDLAWEETKKLEAAIELGFLQDKLSLTASYYRNRCSNQLVSYQLPLNVGNPFVPANLDATVQNTGLEFTVNSVNFQLKNFRWTSSVNLSIPRNKLVSLSPKAYTIDKRLIGLPLNTAFVYSYAGIDPATGQYLFYDGKGGMTLRPDTAIDPVSKISYSKYPLNLGVKYFGGFQNSFSWKNLQLDFLFQFENRRGVTNLRGSYAGSFGKNQPVSVLDHWQKAGDGALVQRYNQNGSLNNANDFLASSNANYADASFVRLENISFSWQLPASLRQKLRLQNARVYSQAQNLFVISHYKGSDPETRSLTSLPPMKVLTVGVQLTF